VSDWSLVIGQFNGRKNITSIHKASGIPIEVSRMDLHPPHGHRNLFLQLGKYDKTHGDADYSLYVRNRENRRDPLKSDPSVESYRVDTARDSCVPNSYT
jgi:hypothetical protein